MALQPTDAFKEIIQKTKKPLIVLPEHPSGDSIASAWALSFYLEEKGITPTIAVSDPFEKRARYGFLPVPTNVIFSLAGVKNFVLVFNTVNNPISNVRTDRRDNELRITLTPERGSIDPRDFSFIPAQVKYDLIIALGCSEKEAIGKLYEEGADIFYEIPIVNMDCQATNDGFGQINIVDLTASSVSEILATVLLAIDNEGGVTEGVAQCLLTGIIVATDSFQQKNTTPNSLYLSAKLIEKGANQQEIIDHLYRTQPLGLIKLWGRIMAKLQWDEAIGFVWAQVTIEDFVQSRMHPNDLPIILEKIKTNYSSGNVFILFYEQKSGTTVGIIKSSHLDTLAKKFESFEYVSHGEYGEVRFDGIGREDAEKKTIEILRG